MARERTRIIAYLRFMEQEDSDEHAGRIAQALGDAEHWQCWDELDDEGQMPPGKAPGAP
ncbi:MAG: hypothetical protein V3W41_12855 [Planctomycetota bacterium]